MNDRVTRLRDALSTQTDLGIFFERVELLERCRELLENQPAETKYAKAFAYLLDNMTVGIGIFFCSE